MITFLVLLALFMVACLIMAVLAGIVAFAPVILFIAVFVLVDFVMIKIIFRKKK